MRAGEKTGKVLSLFNRIPVYLLAFFIFFILLASLVMRAEFCHYRYNDNPAWTRQEFFWLILYVFLIFGCFLMTYWLGNRFYQIGRKQVITTILFLSLIVQILYILFLPAKQFADQDIVNQIALEMLNGNFNAFKKGGYLYQYPNNVGISVLLSFVYSIFPKSLIVPKLINTICSTITSYLTFRVYESLCPEKKNCYGLLLLSSFFLPMILLNNLIYNDIAATTLYAGMIYYSVRFARTKKWPYLIPAALLAVAGNFLRQVGVVFLIAVAMYFIIEHVRLIKVLAFFTIVLILFNVPLTAVNTYLIQTERIKEPLGLNSIPIQMWISIGMNENKFGYWDDSRSWNVYVREGHWNKKKSAQIYNRLIFGDIKQRGWGRVANVYIKKNIWLWTEGTYQAEYYGIGSWGYQYETFATQMVENDYLFRDNLRWILHVINTLMLGLTGVGLTRAIRKKESYCLVLPAIILLGFIGFYTIWEIKPRYIYLVYPYLLMMAYYGLDFLNTRIPRLWKHHHGDKE